ncbi:hypothetical protein HKBW3S03_01004, partial [Candidatus Hakubella thermalkaliphila]
MGALNPNLKEVEEATPMILSSLKLF